LPTPNQISYQFMLSLSLRFLMVLGLVVALPASAPWALAGEEKAPATTQASTAPADADIAKAVKQLDSERFADRQAASEKLEAAGKAAIGALEKAALGDSLEVTTRTIELLQKFGKSPDDATKEAARAALERLAKSDRPAGSRAQEALKTLQPAQGQGLVLGPGVTIVGGVPGIVGNIQIQGGTVQIGGGVSRISISNVNGVKRIEADENGKKVRIDDDPQNGIKMEVTTRKDGKDITEKYEAKNADELKKNFPEAHKLYKQYSEGIGGNMGAIQVRVGAGNAIQIGGGPVATQPAAAAAMPPGLGARDVPIEVTTAMMKHLAEQLQALRNGDRLKNAPASERENLKKQAEELKRQISDLEKQLEKSAKAEAETRKN
jgi:hypothetical protein